MAYVTIAILALSIFYVVYQKALRLLGLGKMSPASDDRSGSGSPQHSDGTDESTPKVVATPEKSEVPTLSLSGDVDMEEDHAPDEETRKAFFPAVNSPQRVSDMPPPPRVPSRQPKDTQQINTMPPSLAKSSSSQSASNLMPPPSMPPPPSRKPAVSSAASLRVPPTGPLPNRGPPAHSQQRASGGLTANGVVASSKPRAKVILEPGHSPMDWAALTRSSNLAGVPGFQRITPSQLRTMTGRKGKPAWSVFQGKVYNITPYVPFHPGGGPELLRAAGRDGTALFNEVHPWVNMENMLESCLVGILVSEQHGHSTLDDID